MKMTWPTDQQKLFTDDSAGIVENTSPIIIKYICTTRAQPLVTFIMAYRFIQSFLHLNIKNKMIRGLALYFFAYAVLNGEEKWLKI